MIVKFNRDQLRVLSEITVGAGQVFLASTVVPILFGPGEVNIKILLFGLILTLTCWTLSVIIARGRLK